MFFLLDKMGYTIYGIDYAFIVIMQIIIMISYFHYIKILKSIKKYGKLGEGILINCRKRYFDGHFLIPPKYESVICFYLNEKKVTISPKGSFFSPLGKKNDVIPIIYWDKYPDNLYICNYNYKKTVLFDYYIDELILIFYLLIVIYVYHIR